MSIKASTVGVATVTALGVAALCFALLPKVGDWTANRHAQEASYATGAEAKGARTAVPRWLPDNATEVHYRMSTTGGDRLLRAKLPDGRLPAECTAGARGGEVRLTAAWFPAGAGARATVSCGLYHGLLAGTDFYAWQDDADWVAANRASAKAS
ncbi:hypothetical protein ACIGXM_08195 [Kitasatospora sp. NPDC052896]|uniref:hypothetical protein n=1 Tax=Kitasatospora sp. NPDC052896 TaxID=3364061 RepID=UPI0037C540EA